MACVDGVYSIEVPPGTVYGTGGEVGVEIDPLTQLGNQPYIEFYTTGAPTLVAVSEDIIITGLQGSIGYTPSTSVLNATKLAITVYDSSFNELYVISAFAPDSEAVFEADFEADFGPASSTSDLSVSETSLSIDIPAGGGYVGLSFLNDSGDDLTDTEGLLTIGYLYCDGDVPDNCVEGSLYWDSTQPFVDTSEAGEGEGDVTGQGPILQPVVTLLNNLGIIASNPVISGYPFIGGFCPGTYEMTVTGSEIDENWVGWWAVEDSPAPNTASFANRDGEFVSGDTFMFTITNPDPGVQRISFGVYGDGAGDPPPFTLTFLLCALERNCGDPDPDPDPIPDNGGGFIRLTPQSPCVLGCPETRVYIVDHCGGQTICDVTDNMTFLKWGRELDNDSEVELTLHLEGDAGGKGCCECLSNLRTWRHELMVVRGGDVVWGPGPLVTISIQRHIAHIVARDVTAWLDVRLIHNPYEFVGVDLTTIAQTLIEDALLLGDAVQIPRATRDACILDYATFTASGKYTDFTIEANKRSAGEVLRELASQGLDFTVVNRALYVGADFAFGPIGPLRDDDFAEDLLAAEHGLAAATKWWVSSDNAQGSAGGVDPYFGLIERGVEGQPAATSVTDLSREASDRLQGTNPPPFIVTVPSEGQLSPGAPVCSETLIPGTLVDLAINELCRPASLRERLTSLRVVLDEKGERVGITLAPLGEFSQGLIEAEVPAAGDPD